ncbi:hypothetical protein [Clostridium sp. CF012]|uniref:hypothetical protein n=1 Tax=Clostridium sp. CF012 TaxID=2843319 RepID=UPI001C0D5AB5|nr:hypothetical protein [Clostridium sp. CF012]MBU3145754.1 hypothetical protein [Clostridium sp. CF012]
MLRKALENRVGHLSNAEFAIVCNIATDDLKFNRINFKKSTSINYVLDIAVRCSNVFKSCN